MQAHTAKAQKRTLFGRKSKALRRSGMVPGTIYGKGMNALAIELPLEDAKKLYREAGETGLINLTVDGTMYPVLIKTVQINPIHRDLLNIEFYKVNLKEKVKTHVPVVLMGEAEAMKEKVGTLLQLVNELEVEALPASIPEHLEISIEGLAAVNDAVFVRDIPKTEGVVIMAEDDLMVAKIGVLAAPEPEPVAETPAEGEAAAAAEAPTEEKKEEGSPEPKE